MSRSLHLVVVVATVISILVLAPASLAALPGGVVRRPGALGRYSITQVRRVLKDIFRFIKILRQVTDIIDSLETLLPPSESQKSSQTETPADTIGLYIFNISVGASSSSLQSISGVLDISSQLVWSQCAPCTACLPAPTFQPKESANFSRVPCGSERCQSVLNQTCPANVADDYCGYVAVYGDDTNTTGYLATDTFRFGKASFPDFVFGCSGSSVGNISVASGIFGFGRGPLSLVSQLKLSWFSYSLASEEPGSTSTIEFGDYNVIWTPSNITSSSTPLLTSRQYPDLYFVNLTGITVDGKLLRDVPAGTFDIPANGSGGTFLSTTVPFTFLEEAAYNVLKQAFNDTMTKQGAQHVNGSSALGLDLCYTINSMTNVTVPDLALVFDGAGVVMNLSRSNYFSTNNDSDLECLTILPSQGFSLLGSLLQTDRNMTYDIARSRLIFDKVAVAHQTAAAPPVNSLSTSLMAVLPLAVSVVMLF